MKKHVQQYTLALALVCAFTTQAFAQIRPERTFFLEPKVGISNYLGDNDTTPFDFDDWGVENEFAVPWTAALGFGYQLTSFSLHGEYQIANYPTITAVNIPGNPGTNGEDRVRHTGKLFFRWTALRQSSRVSPFLEVGLAGTARGSELGWGPMGGIGLDFALTDRLSFLLELQSHVATPDEAVDYAAGEGFSDDIDLLNALNLGLRINFKSAFTPVVVTGLTCPTTVQSGQSASFTAMTNENATQPVTYSWNFGDGGTGTGMSTSYTFNRPGTYTVTFSAANDDTPATQICTVTVTAPPVPAGIASATANPMRFDVCEERTVQFSATGRGDEPVTYTWDFGDGTTATGTTASHVYRTPGTYTVTLRASNALGQDSRTMTVTAEPCRTGVCYEVTEMNSVFFDRNASALSNEARTALRENLEILQECPNLCARIEGFAGPDERNAQDLSEDRARAVMQFYTDNGIAATRLTSTGRGAAGGQTTKKEGTSQLRRADTIPMQCEDMR